MNGLRKYGVAVLMLVLFAFVVGCGSKPGGNVPDWYLNLPDSSDKIYGVGASEKTSSVQLGKSTADQYAIRQISATMQTSIQSMLRSYLQQSGTIDDGARALQFSELVTKQVIDTTISGIVVERSEVHDSQWFSLASISKDSIKSALIEQARDAAAEYSELKAKEAFDALEKEINKGNF